MPLKATLKHPSGREVGPLMSGGIRRQSHEGVAGYPCLMDYYVKLHVR